MLSHGSVMGSGPFQEGAIKVSFFFGRKINKQKGLCRVDILSSLKFSYHYKRVFFFRSPSPYPLHQGRGSIYEAKINLKEGKKKVINN